MEIASWIADNLQDEGRYVIIDDEYVIQDSQLPHFILTNPYDGITADLANTGKCRKWQKIKYN